MERNGTGGPGYPREEDPLYILVVMTVLYSVILVTGLIGNVITCLVIYRNKHMHTATNYYLFSLAISDLLLLISGLPQEIYYIWSRNNYLFGEVFCVLRGMAAETSANATVLTITAFTVERYVAICHPFQAHTMSKLSRAFKIIIGIWLVALAFAIPQALQFGVVYSPDGAQCTVKRILVEYSFEVSTILFFITPMSVITVLYVLIGLKLRQTALVRYKGSFTNRHSSAYGDRNNSSQRVLKMLVAVVVAFFICWAPFHAQRLVAIYGGSQEGNTPISPLMVYVYAAVTYTSGVLYYLSTTINPILYHIMSLKFREAFKGMLWGGWCRKSKQRSYAVLTRRGENSSGHTDSGASGPGALSAAQRKAEEAGGGLTEMGGPSRRQAQGSRGPRETRLGQSPDISNSSLKDVDREALRDELASYQAGW